MCASRHASRQLAGSGVGVVSVMFRFGVGVGVGVVSFRFVSVRFGSVRFGSASARCQFAARYLELAFYSRDSRLT